MRWIAICGALALIPALATAGETPVQLKRARGVEIVEGRCGACHSVDYIVMNSPFLAAAGWEKEVTKMIHAFGAPIDKEDTKTIVDYLAQNYGG